MKHLEFAKDQIEGTVLAYSLPGTSEYLLATVGEIIIPEKTTDLAEYDFVFSPYNSDSLPALYFKITSLASGRKFSCHPQGSTDIESTSFKEYSTVFENVKSQIESKSIGKAVISKRKVIPCDNPNLYDSFIDLKNCYPQAFTYLVHIPGFTTWIGVSPELVLSSDGSSYQSRAIAGTKKNDETSVWTEKEYNEHALVEDHYRDVLSVAEIKYSISDRLTHEAGKICHLRSDISMLLDKKISTRDLLDTIHPSPALSGYPKEKSIEIINELEAHSREYYCGYLGPISADGSLQLFANIRCAKAYKNAFILYVGGGITDGSVLEEEWQETELKSETLSTIIDRVLQTSTNV